ncbi:hypothetical protein GC170_17960 [bacterium]|nr:hypothetical protein [bacterium]
MAVRCSRIRGSFAWALTLFSLLAVGHHCVAQEEPPVGFPEIVGIPQPGEIVPVQATGPQQVESRLFGTIFDSIFGPDAPETWHPLPFSTLLTEGWNESWVSSPNGSGGAPRQGWINAQDGNFYRLWWFTYSQGFNSAPKSDSFLGGYTLYSPFSRRFLLITNVPFYVRNVPESGQPFHHPANRDLPQGRPLSGVGNLMFTPRVLLHETQDLSVTAEMIVSTPTGTGPLGGSSTTLTPVLGFWTNVADGWVVRGGTGIQVPTRGGAESYINQLAVGQTLTGHDVPIIGDFTWYVSTLISTPLDNAGNSHVSLTPGFRSHVGNNWYLLGGLQVPVTKGRNNDLDMIFWFMKAW